MPRGGKATGGPPPQLNKGQRSIASFFAAKPRPPPPPAPAPAPGPAEAAEGPVGRRVSVYWPEERRSFAGVVDAGPDAKGQVHVTYDDGDAEWLSLEKRKHEWLPEGAPPPPRKRRKAAGKGVLLESAGEEEEEEDAPVSEPASESDYEASQTEASETEEDESDYADSEGEAKPQPKRKPRPQPPPPAAEGAPAAQPPGRPLPAGATAPAKAPAERAELKRRLDAESPFAAAAAAARLSVAGRERFLDRDLAKFPFLQPGQLKDAEGRRPDHPRYDPSTLHIPPGWFKQEKISPGQQQWWRFKALNFDSVLFFKMGKFYELLEMDAHVGAEHLGLTYMKGDQPHCGFPEKSYADQGEKLASKGFRVVVVEQTETPEQNALRNEGRKARGLKRDGTLRREKVAVLSPGTLDGDMLSGRLESAPIVSLLELPGAVPAPAAGRGACIGVCAADASTGTVLVGVLRDDANRSKLRTFLASVRPAEVVFPRYAMPGKGVGRLTPETLRSARYCPSGPKLSPLSTERFYWDEPLGPLRERDYFAASAPGAGPGHLPEAIAGLCEPGGPGELALRAFGGMVRFLEEAMLDVAVLSLGRVERLPEDGIPAAKLSVNAADEHVLLDASALENLEILENAEGTTAGTLLAQLDHCATASGHRMMRQWLLRPLKSLKAIEARQGAVADLLGPAAGSAAAARSLLRKVPDLERVMKRLSASGKGLGRDGPNVVLYEDVGRKRLDALLGALRGFETLSSCMALFRREASGPFDSSYLKALVTPGEGFPDLRSALREFKDAFDWDQADAEGRVVPNAGVDAGYDGAVAEIGEVERRLDGYLAIQRERLGAGTRVKYVTVHKDAYQIEVPESAFGAVPAEYQLASQKKGSGKQPAVKRYVTDETVKCAKELEAAEEKKQEALTSILRNLLLTFCDGYRLWNSAVDAAAELDCLISLSIHASVSDGAMCRPSVVGSECGPVFKASGLRNPNAVVGRCGSFVPNDFSIGGGEAPFLLLTGPNMGGKSTLLRQVCLATVLAQVGACVPADGMELSIVDAIYVRMGAKDAIMAGQSTFFIELNETAAVLRHATEHSLVALDELGRGTATTDGRAIAGAVMEHILEDLQCRTLFSTHYRSLADPLKAAGRVAVKHMGCSVGRADPNDEDAVPDVAFLYKLTDGAAPSSYGVNVARLAGVPRNILCGALRSSERILGGAARSAGEVPVPAALLTSVLSAIGSGADPRSAPLKDVWARAQGEVEKLSQ